MTVFVAAGSLTVLGGFAFVAFWALATILAIVVAQHFQPERFTEAANDHAWSTESTTTTTEGH